MNMLMVMTKESRKGRWRKGARKKEEKWKKGNGKTRKEAEQKDNGEEA